MSWLVFWHTSSIRVQCGCCCVCAIASDKRMRHRNRMPQYNPWNLGPKRAKEKLFTYFITIGQAGQIHGDIHLAKQDKKKLLVRFHDFLFFHLNFFLYSNSCVVTLMNYAFSRIRLDRNHKNPKFIWKEEQRTQKRLGPRGNFTHYNFFWEYFETHKYTHTFTFVHIWFGGM